MREINKDIFEWIEENRKDNKVILIHCISSDWALGAGIAKAIDEKFQEKESLKRAFPEKPEWKGKGFGLITPRPTLEEVSPHLYICNLVTKEHYWNKPTYTTLSDSLENVKALLQVLKSKAKEEKLGFKIVMPRIGCGLDKLRWSSVKEIVLQWAGVDFDVTVCYL